MSKAGDLYGQSLYDLAVEENLTDVILKEMEVVRGLFVENPDYVTLLSKLRPDGYITMEDGQGDVKIGYVCQLLKPGATAPLAYCEGRIRDIVISNRKHALLASLEQDLLKNALDQEKLIIY